MTTGGWIFMLISLTCVWGLAGWCYYRVLTAPAPTVEPDTAAGEDAGPPR